jgi:hypothetical protein
MGDQRLSFVRWTGTLDEEIFVHNNTQRYPRIMESQNKDTRQCFAFSAVNSPARLNNTCRYNFMAIRVRRDFEGRLLTYEEAVEENVNLFSLLKCREWAQRLKQDLWQKCEKIRNLVCLHLGLSEQDQCNVLKPRICIKRRV